MAFWDTPVDTKTKSSSLPSTPTKGSIFGLTTKEKSKPVVQEKKNPFADKSKLPPVLQGTGGPLDVVAPKTRSVPDILNDKEKIQEGANELAKGIILPIVREGVSLVQGHRATFKDIFSRATESFKKGDVSKALDTLSPVPKSIDEAKRRFDTFTGAETSPKGDLAQRVTGKEEPFSLQTEGKDLASSFGFDIKNKSALGGIGLLSAALDFTPFGGEKNAAKALVKAKDAEEAATHLKRMGIADSALPKLSEELVSLGTEAERQKWVDEVLSNFKNPKSEASATAVPEKLTDLSKDAEKQIEDYKKEGVFLEEKDTPRAATIPMSNFNGKDISASQLTVDRSGVDKWKKRIQAGERPFVLVDESLQEPGVFKVVDGHHRLNAYKELGIEDVPVIDRNGKLSSLYETPKGAVTSPSKYEIPKATADKLDLSARRENIKERVAAGDPTAMDDAISLTKEINNGDYTPTINLDKTPKVLSLDDTVRQARKYVTPEAFRRAIENERFIPDPVALKEIQKRGPDAFYREAMNTQKLRGVTVADESIPKDLRDEKQLIEDQMELIRDNGILEFKKYEKQGELPEVTGSIEGKRQNKFERQGDIYVEEYGYPDTEAFREGYESTKKNYESLKSRLADVNKRITTFKDGVRNEAALEKLSKKGAKADDVERDKRANENNRKLEIAKKNAGLQEEKNQAKIRSQNEARIRQSNYQSETKPLGFFGKVKQALYPVKVLDKDTQHVLREWENAYIKAPKLADREVTSFNIPKSKMKETIHAYEAGLDTPYSKEIKAKFDALRREATSRDLSVDYRANYLPHVYREDPVQIKKAIQRYLEEVKGMKPEEIEGYMNGEKLAEDRARRMSLSPFFVKDRAFDTYAIAAQYGLHPRFEDLNHLAAYYRENMERAIANRNMLEGLLQKGKIQLAEYAPANWDALKLTFSPKGYYAEPKLARVLNDIFKDPNSRTFTEELFNVVAQLSRKAQEIALSGGLPKTNINYFAIGVLIKQLMAGDIKALPTFVRANMTGKSIEYFKENSKYIEMMADQGIDLGEIVGSYKKEDNLYNAFTDAKEAYADVKNAKDKEALIESSKKFATGFKDTVGVAFDEAFNEKTFSSFLPQLYTQYFKDSYVTAIKDGIREVEASKLAGDITKNMFGIIENLGRSPETKNKLSAVFFAPRFREAVVNTLFNTGKAGTNLFMTAIGKGKLDPALKGNRKLLAGMAITYGTYNLINYELTGHFMWDNPPNRQYALQIPYGDDNGPDGQKYMYIEFMPSFLAFARNMLEGGSSLLTGDFTNATQKFGSLLSMPIKLTTEVIANQDYFGRPIYAETDKPLEKTKKIAKYLGLGVSHPYVKQIGNYMEGKQTLTQTVSMMTELPLKFGNEKSISTNQFYEADAKRKEQAAKEKAEIQPIYDQVQELVKEGRTDEAQALVDSLGDKGYAIYKTIRSAEKTKKTKAAKAAMYTTYEKVQKLVKAGELDKVNAILDDMTDEEYKTYQSVKKQFSK